MNWIPQRSQRLSGIVVGMIFMHGLMNMLISFKIVAMPEVYPFVSISLVGSGLGLGLAEITIAIAHIGNANSMIAEYFRHFNETAFRLKEIVKENSQ